jgi:hypothetical protein
MTTTAQKAIQRRVYTTKAELLADLHNIMAEHLPHNAALAGDALLHNFPQFQGTDDDGNPAAFDVFGFENDDASPYGGKPAFAPGFTTFGSATVIPVYEGHSAPRPEGRPLAIPIRLYVIHGPSVEAIGSNKALAEFYQTITKAALLTAAAKQAKAHSADPTKSPLLSDPIAALLSTIRAAKKDDAWRRMFPHARDIVLAIGKQQAERAKAAGNTAMARKISHAFDKAQFTDIALGQALQSTRAATALFPALPAPFFVKLLQALISACPNATKRQQVKDADGNPVKDADGKTLYHDVPAPVSPTTFLAWLETRDQTDFEAAPLDMDMSTFFAT